MYIVIGYFVKKYKYTVKVAMAIIIMYLDLYLPICNHYISPLTTQVCELITDHGKVSSVTVTSAGWWFSSGIHPP